MSFSCLRPSDPNTTAVDLLYTANTDEGHLYSGSGTPPLCSSTSPPTSSDCKVCWDQFVRVVCSNLPRSETLVMEGAGRQVDLEQSECPRLLGDAGPPSIISGGALEWWKIFLIFLVVLVVMVIVLLVAYRVCGKTRQQLTGFWRRRMSSWSSHPSPSNHKFLNGGPPQNTEHFSINTENAAELGVGVAGAIGTPFVSSSSDERSASSTAFNSPDLLSEPPAQTGRQICQTARRKCSLCQDEGKVAPLTYHT